MKIENFRFCGNEIKYLKEVLDSGFISSTTGSMNRRLEEAFAKRFDVNYAITVNSATSGLHAALVACGVKPGDEVIVPAVTVVMCGYAVIQAGAAPVFADVDNNTFLIDPLDIERKITPQTKAIMVVNLYGLMANMDKIMEIAKKHNLYVIEDCAEAFLSTDNKNRIAGTVGHLGVYSFENSKHMSTGDGGIVVTNSEVLAERVRKFAGMGFKNIKANFGQVRKNKEVLQDPNYLRHDAFGFNYRLTELAAAVGLAQVERLDYLVSLRKTMARKFTEAIEETGCKYLVPQQNPEGYVNSYFTFAARFDGQEQQGISWYDFRKKFVEFGNDGIYGAWALVYNEPCMKMLDKEGKFFSDMEGQGVHHKGYMKEANCPVAENLQPKLMQFPANQGSESEMDVQADALRKTILYFK